MKRHEYNRMRLRRQWPMRVLSLAVIALLGSAGTKAASPEAAGYPAPEPSTLPGEPRPVIAPMCGPNSLYIFSSLIGVNADPGIVTKYVPKNPAGMSLQEMQFACKGLGIDADVVHLAPPQRISIRGALGEALPCIAHCVPRHSAGGHYVVVVKVERDGVTFYDGADGGMRTFTNTEFSTYWSGYALVPRRRAQFSNATGFVGIAFGASALSAVVFGDAWRRYRARRAATRR